MPMSNLVNVATCCLNQFALDFTHNLANVIASIRIAKQKHCRLRLGPELEICGYGCEDHYFEDDTIRHCWECLAVLLTGDLTDDIVCDVGMPVLHLGVRYNCRILLLNRRIIMIRPKMWLAEDGNYREGRWFAGWTRGYQLEDFGLPKEIRDVTRQTSVPFGVGCVQFGDTTYANETCEELYTANNPGIVLALSGAEIIGNASGSHFSMGKSNRRTELIAEQTKKNGGCYLYANFSGCDGGRLYFDGGSLIAVNGGIVAHGEQFSLRDVQVCSATIDLNDVRNYRSSIASRGRQAAAIPTVAVVKVPDFYLGFRSTCCSKTFITEEHPLVVYGEEQEAGESAACWLWDYLRRSGLQGLFLPLSGGSDSACVAAIVYGMCNTLIAEVECEYSSNQTLVELRRITKDPEFTPKTAKDICGKILFCCYMGTEHSSDATQAQARQLSAEIGCRFDSVNIDAPVEALLATFEQIGKRPDITRGGTAENVACQNLQARTRMVMSYLCAQLLLGRETPDAAWPGALLVLGSSNLDEALRGYFTKYDCSSADINPIGSLPKKLIRQLLVYGAKRYNCPMMETIAKSVASAELQPMAAVAASPTGRPSAFDDDASIARQQQQNSEDEMGMTFDEIDTFGRLRLEQRCGPLSMYMKLVRQWSTTVPRAGDVAEKVKRFFRYYSLNRHKMSTLTPAVHAGSHSPDDHRYDLRQIIYNCQWPWQFKAIDEDVAQVENCPVHNAVTAASPARKRGRE
jgi:NAD+ synthase (glutamine-hydrolysing)